MISPLWIASGDEGERQAILLALAKLAQERPGWDDLLGRIAERFQGREMFEQFKLVSPPPIVAVVERLRRVAAQCGAGGHASRERLLNALANEIEFKNFGAGESTKGSPKKRGSPITPAPEDPQC